MVSIRLLAMLSNQGACGTCSHIWAAAGKQLELEKQVGVGGYGYPALVALNVNKGAYAPLRSAFEFDHVV